MKDIGAQGNTAAEEGAEEESCNPGSQAANRFGVSGRGLTAVRTGDDDGMFAECLGGEACWMSDRHHRVHDGGFRRNRDARVHIGQPHVGQNMLKCDWFSKLYNLLDLYLKYSFTICY